MKANKLIEIDLMDKFENVKALINKEKENFVIINNK
jgi:hypothetical protein